MEKTKMIILAMLAISLFPIGTASAQNHPLLDGNYCYLTGPMGYEKIELADCYGRQMGNPIQVPGVNGVSTLASFRNGDFGKYHR